MFVMVQKYLLILRLSHINIPQDGSNLKLSSKKQWHITRMIARGPNDPEKEGVVALVNMEGDCSPFMLRISGGPRVCPPPPIDH